MAFLRDVLQASTLGRPSEKLFFPRLDGWIITSYLLTSLTYNNICAVLEFHHIVISYIAFHVLCMIGGLQELCGPQGHLLCDILPDWSTIQK